MATKSKITRRRTAGPSRPRPQRTAATARAGREEAPAARPFLARWSAALTLFGAGVIHAAHAQVHLEHWALAGIFFAVVGTAQGMLAAGFLLGAPRSRVLIVGALAVSLGSVAIWLVSRTLGLPFGPGAGVPEAIGRADIVAAMLEIATAAALLPQLTRSTRETGEPPHPFSYVALGAMVAAVPLMTGFAVTGSALHHEHPGESPSLALPGAATGNERAESLGHHHHGASSQQTAIITARTLAFDKSRIVLEAGVPSAIHLRNRDSVAHNISLYRASGKGAPVVAGRVVPAGAEGHLRVPTSRPGLYAFRCDLHRSMRGMLSVT